MRIFAPLPTYPPGARIGAFLATHRFLAFMVTRGHQVTVNRNVEFIRTIVERQPYTLDGVDVIAEPDASPAVNDLVDAADVIVSHMGDRHRGARIAELALKPSVRMVHGTPLPPDMTADLVVFNSHWIIPRGFEGRHIVCHPPVPPAEFATAPGDRITLVNLHKMKGGYVFDRLTRGMPDHLFLGVDGGYGRSKIVPRRPNVQIVPSTTNMRDDVYRHTRILLMPSLYESWGMVAVEAMASGIPVIAHPTEGLQECLSYAGIFCDRDDITGWEREIRRLDDPDEWAAASLLARKRSAELDPLPHLERFACAVEALCDS